MRSKLLVYFGLLAVSLQLSFIYPKESWSSHALYLGTLQLKYQAEEQEAFLDLKVFSDDLQSAIRNAYQEFQPGPLSTLFSQNQSLIEDYFTQHLTLRINDVDHVPQLYQSEQMNDAYLLQFKFTSPAHWTKLELTADFFMELFPNQINVVSVAYQQQKQFARLSKKQPTCAASFTNSPSH